jgi:hypothetical protein
MMTPDQRGAILRSRFLQVSFGQRLQISDAYSMLLRSLSDDDLINMQQRNVFFCRSYAPASVTDLKNVPAVDSLLMLIDFENEYLEKLTAEQTVAIILHEIGHVFYPADNLRQREFNADDFAIEKGYANGLRTSLEYYMKNFPEKFKDPINEERLTRIVEVLNKTTEPK